jgi:hypothetical protein
VGRLSGASEAAQDEPGQHGRNKQLDHGPIMHPACERWRASETIMQSPKPKSRLVPVPARLSA